MGKCQSAIADCNVPTFSLIEYRIVIDDSKPESERNSISFRRTFS